MAKTPLHYVDLRAFCYATEDAKRVEAALRCFLPEEFPIDRVETEGHYGDRILVLSSRVETADEIRHVLGQLAELDDFERLLAELDDRVTENTEFFVTLDKQAAFTDAVRLGDGITLRAKVEAYPATRDGAIENARDLLSQLADEH